MTPQQRVSQAMEAVVHGSKWTAKLPHRFYHWLFAPLCDNWKGLSLNRFLAVLFGLAATWGVFQKISVPLTWPDIAAMVVSGSLAFGKDVFLAYINRNGAEKDHA